jgi:hypothetical protein
MPKNHTPPANGDGASEVVQEVAVAGAKTVMRVQSGVKPMPTGPAADAPPARYRVERLAPTHLTAAVPTMPTGLAGQAPPADVPAAGDAEPGSAT